MEKLRHSQDKQTATDAATMEFFSDANNQEQKTYIVLGGHRCGTSFMGRALHKAGIKISGDPGRFEDIEFVKLNERILADNNVDWRNPPSSEIVCNRQDEIEALMKKKRASGGQFWGWKDPRQALTIDHYLPYLEGDTYLICIFRKPEKSAESLANMGQSRNGVNMSLEYNRRIIEAVKRFIGL